MWKGRRWKRWSFITKWAYLGVSKLLTLKVERSELPLKQGSTLNWRCTQELKGLDTCKNSSKTESSLPSGNTQELEILESRKNSTSTEVSLESCCTRELESLQSRKKVTDWSLESGCTQEWESLESCEISSKTGWISRNLESWLNSMSAWVESANTELKRWVSGELSFNNEGCQAK